MEALADAVRLDAGFAMALAVLAIASKWSLGGDAWRAPMATAQRCRAISRRERQQIDVIALALDERFERASALGLEHLCEFPDDVIVALVIHAPTDVLAERPVAQDAFE